MPTLEELLAKAQSLAEALDCGDVSLSYSGSMGEWHVAIETCREPRFDWGYDEECADLSTALTKALAAYDKVRHGR